MFTEKIMNINERRTYLSIAKKLYDSAPRAERSHLLDDMEEFTGLHRKSILRLFQEGLERHLRKRQRGRGYGAEVEEAVLLLAESLDYPCAERLTPVLLSTAQLLQAHHELSLSPSLQEALQQVSISTVRRIMQRSAPKTTPLFPRQNPRPPNPILRDVPMKRIPWNEPQPGHLEMDLVQHSGPETSGDFAYTLQMIDVATAWSARRALLGRSFLVMEDALRYLLAQLPFPVLEVHSDNGAEFFNYHLVRFWQQPAYCHIQLSRSRPYRKNDNRIVEQKNYTLVRAYFGQQRFDTVAQTLLLNRIYERMNPYYNLFQPVLHLAEKEPVFLEGKYIGSKRHYDAAQTPFARLCATQAITSAQQEELEQLRLATNPRSLRQEIYALIAELRSLPGAIPGQVEDVFLTLAEPLITGTWLQHRKESRTLR